MRPSIRTSILVPGFIATPSTRLITWDSVRELHIGIVFFPVRTRNAFCVSEKIGSERSATPLGRLVGLPDKSFRFVTQKDSVAGCLLFYTAQKRSYMDVVFSINAGLRELFVNLVRPRNPNNH